MAYERELLPENVIQERTSCSITCKLIARKIIGTDTNKSCQVTTASTKRAEQAFMVDETEKIRPNGTSRSIILRSEETCT